MVIFACFLTFKLELCLIRHYHYHITESNSDYIIILTSEFYAVFVCIDVNFFLPVKEFLLAFLVRQLYWWWTSSIFACSGKYLSPFHFWRTALPDVAFLIDIFFQILNISPNSLLAWEVSVEKSIHNFMGISLYVTSLAFKILWFLVIITCLHVALFRFSMSPLGLTDLDVHFFPQGLGNFQPYYCFKSLPLLEFP